MGQTRIRLAHLNTVVCSRDGENKKRLSQLSKYPTSIASLSFNTTGDLLAVASSYTFEEGEKECVVSKEMHAPFLPLACCSHPADSVFIHRVSESEVRPKTSVVPE